MTKKQLTVLLVILGLLLTVAACQRQCDCSLDDVLAQAYQTKVYLTSGGDKLVVASGGEVEIQSGATADYQEGATYTLPAADKVAIDGDTTNQTQTAGVVDVNVGTVTDGVTGINVAVTQDTGTTAAADALGMVMTLTGNDADGDVMGIKMTAAATTNAAANTYEYGLLYDCAENTVGACPDGILVTATGGNTVMTDGLDVSDGSIVNAVNVGSNLVLGGNSDYFTIGATDASFIVTRNDAGSVTFMGADNSTPADTIYDTTGAGKITMGSGDVTDITLTTDGSGTAEVVLPTGAIGGTEIDDDTVDGVDIADIVALDTTNIGIKNSSTGGVIFNFHDYADSADDDMAHVVLTANCTDATTGAEDCDLTIGVVEAGAAAETRLNIDADGGIVVGSANNASVTLTTDGTGDAEVTLPAGSVATAEIADDTITFANISDSSAVDADTTLTMGDGIELVLQPSYTTGDTEALLIEINQVDDAVNTDDMYALLIAATSESGDAGDTCRAIGINWENGTANTIMDAAIVIDNAETTAATMTDAIIVTSSGVDAGVTDAIDVSAANILNAMNIGDNDVLVGTLFGVKNGATGSVILNFHDYADTTDDDMAHAAITVNCTDTGTGAEDCDLTIGVVEGGNAAETRFNIDADAGITIGSANNNLVTVTTDGTGDAELAMPENSIGPDEVAVMHDYVIACGEAAENGTIYYGPATAVFGGNGSASYAISSVACDALDDATEATADAPIFTNVAFKVSGLYCKQSGTLGVGEAVTFTVRSAAANTTPVISCIVSAGETDCRSLTGSTTDIAAGATIAVQAVQNGDNADDDHWCKVYIAYK